MTRGESTALGLTARARPAWRSVDRLPVTVISRASRRRRTLPVVLLRAARPRQWLKNALVVAAPFAGGALFEARVLARLAIALLAFCLVASATYLVNDLRDVEHDRRHPEKRDRPIASGALSTPAAVTAALATTALGVCLAVTVSVSFLVVVLSYVALTLAYSFWLKRLAVVDIVAVAGCYLLRAVAGGAAAAISLSGWFLAVVSFAALFVVAGKRYVEHRRMGAGRERTRAALASYSAGVLRTAWRGAALATVIAYGLWAFAHPERHLHIPWGTLSILPFAFGVTRYATLLQGGRGDCPEEIAYSDRVLQVSGLIWVATFAVGACVSA